MITRLLRVITLLACTSGCTILGGAFNSPPEALNKISPEAHALIKIAYADIGEGQTMDYHNHIVGLGKGGTGAYVNPSMQSLLYPVKYFQFSVYKTSSGITDIDNADAQYVDRFVRLVKGIPNQGKFQILAFDKYYNEKGESIEEKTQFYTPNRYVMDLATKYPDIFVPTISVHPYRKDAVERLDYWANRGAKLIKWLPNTMGIDPSNPILDAYYDAVKRNKMVIHTHVGEEKAVEAEEDQKYGNPLLFRRALDRGVKVIMAHVASLGTGIDLDDSDKKEVPNFDLFLRLMDEKKYQGLLFGEISGITQVNRLPVPLTTMIEREDLHSRLVNGSDYPVPAINVVIWTSRLASKGFITANERHLLNQIYDVNPLLFDFVLKRTLRHPKSRSQFPPEVFLEHPDL